MGKEAVLVLRTFSQSFQTYLAKPQNCSLLVIGPASCSYWVGRTVRNERSELRSTDALRKVRYDPIDVKGEGMLDVAGRVCRVNDHEHVRTVE